MGQKRKTTIAVTTEVRDKIKSKLRGGQTYDDLLADMVDQYDPPEPTGVTEATGD